MRTPDVSGRRRNALIAAALVLLIAVFSFLPVGRDLWHSLLRIAGLTHFTDGISEAAVHIHVISVGKADAILVESPDADLLIDTGTEDMADAVRRYLGKRGVTELDSVWISHPDSDHIGGLSAILETVPVGTVYFSPTADLPDGLASLENLAVPSSGDVFDFGSFRLEVLGPGDIYPDPNNNSLVLRLSCGGRSVLFCGDMEADAEEDLLSSGVDLHADILKVGHHGSNTSSTEPFLEAVSPEYAVISSGEDRNLLPRNTILKRFADLGIQVFRTDTEGTVVFSLEDGDIRIRTEKGGEIQ